MNKKEEGMSGSGDVYLDEIHKAVSEKNYKALLQNDIAAYNLKANTEKYLDNYLADKGLGSQGYGTSAHIGIGNQAQNLYASNLEAYNQGEQDALLAAQDRKNAAATESDNQLITYLQYSDGSEQSIAGYMDKYGYKLENGQWVNKETNEPASPYVLAAIQSVAEGSSASAYSNIESSTPQGSETLNWLKANASGYQGADQRGYSTASSLGQAVVGTQDNTASGTMRDIVGDEIDAMEEWVSKNPDKADGTLFRLERGSGTHHETYLVLYAGGRYYIVSDDDREQEGRQVSNRYNEYAGNKVYFKGGQQQN